MRCPGTPGHRAAQASADTPATGKAWLRLLSILGMLLVAACAQLPVTPGAQPFKVAFIGDTGYDPQDTPALDSNFEQVLDLVRSEGAHLLAIAGDFSYEEETDVARVYFGTIDRILGERFPVLGADGNHDDWAHYQPFFQARLENMGLNRTLISGDEYGLRFGGIQWVILGERGNAAFVRTQFARDDDAWRVCMWHKNMRDMQTGDKRDGMDWATYRACQEAGAMIATGNEHSYARTVTLTDLGNRAAGHGATGAPDRLEVGPGRTFVFVSGLGGKSLRDYECAAHDDDTWWATVYTRNYYLRAGTPVAKSCAKGTKEYETAVQGYTYGALFITFNTGGDPDQAEAYFKTINGDIIDTFSIVKSQPLR
jgi:Calcineurin-like phosphoesterase